MGKHRIKKHELRKGDRSGSSPVKTRYPVLKGTLITLVLLLVFGAVAGFAYVKYIEGRLGKKAREIELTEPVSGEPVNVLIIGSDARGKEKARSDTLIILHIDPKKKKAALISIPRDIRVEIPGEGMNKINAAYVFGEAELTIRTVEKFAGISIHHYVETDFKGFQRMVDAVGGVEINVERNYRDKKAKAYLDKGPQVLNGKQALAYVRIRYSDPEGDIGRTKRQQKFLRALFRQALRLRSVWKIPTLINIFVDNSQTDLTVSEVAGYAALLRGMKEDDLETLTLPGEPKAIGGVSYVVPDEEEIEEIFSRLEKGLSLKPKAEEKLVLKKDIRLKVLNGCGVAGVASEVASELSIKGYKVVGIGNADDFDYDKTTILYEDGQQAKAEKVQKEFPGSEIELSSNAKGADVLVVVGKDYTL